MSEISIAEEAASLLNQEKLNDAFRPETGEFEVNIGDVRRLLETNDEFFIQFFLGEELVFPIPEFHLDIFSRMTSLHELRFVCAVPRGHAKTTLAKLAVVKLMLFSPFKFFIYLSASHGIAAPACRDIIAFIESDNFRQVFGPIEYKIRREGEGFYQFRIPALDKNLILRAQGAQQQVRGLNVDNTRPDCAIIDDFEDVETTANQKTFENLVRWLYGTFLKALNQFRNKVVQIGNMVSQDCLLKRHIEDDDWNSLLYGAILENGEPLWPDLWTIERLIKDFRTHQMQGLSDIWFREMMNQPIAPDGGIIRAMDITYEAPVMPDMTKYNFVTLDPAVSSRRWAHRLCACVHSYVENEYSGVGWWQITDYIHGRGINPVLLWPQIKALMLRWKAQICGIEAVAYQTALQYVFADYARSDGLFTFEFVPVTAALASKTMRIAAFAGELRKDPARMAHAPYALTSGDWAMTQQLLNYAPTSEKNDDDLIDAAAYGPQMIQRYLPKIMQPWQKSILATGTSISMSQISRV